MFPTPTILDRGNSPGGYAVNIPDLFRCMTGFDKIFDFTNLVCGQFRQSIFLPKWCTLTKFAIRMRDVFRTIAPLQVGNPVVNLYSILVINMVFAFDFFQKSVRNKSVNSDPFFYRVNTETHREISGGTKVAVKQSGSFAVDSRLASNLSKIRDAVDSFVTRYCFPLLECDKKLFGHKPFLVKVFVLAPLSIQLTGVNFLYQLFGQRERISYG